MTTDAIPAVARAAALTHRDRIALSDDTRQLDYGTYVGRAEDVARGIRALGVGRGGRVAVWAPNSIEHAVVVLGIYLAGAVLVPVNTRFRQQELAQVLADARVRLLVTVESFLGRGYADEARALGLPDLQVATVEDLESWVVRDGPLPSGTTKADDIATVLFTSGTTGRPKGAMLRHGALVRGYREWSALTGMGPDDRVIVTNPFFHAFGLFVGLLAPLLHGARARPVALFEPSRVLEILRRERISYYPAPPTVFAELAERVRSEGTGPLPELRAAVIGATVIPRPTVDAMYDVLGIQRVHVPYGFTEASALGTLTRAGDSRDLVCTTAGVPLPGVNVRIVDETGRPVSKGSIGEIVVSGFSVMPGYLDPATGELEESGTGGTVASGDLGHFDPAGNLVVDGRIKDVVIVGGFNVYPAEVEACLLEHPAVAEVTVVGRPDDRLGEVAAAFVRLSPPLGALPSDLVDWCRERLANFKVPREVRELDHLPTNAAGKVVKDELRAMLA